MPLRSLAALSMLLFAAVPPLSAQAQAARVEVQVYVIHASNEGSEVDPRLEDLRRQLSAFSFTSFRLLDVHERKLSLGESAKISLPGERVLTVSPRRLDQKGQLRLRLSIGDLVDTTYSIAEGATIIVGGPRHEGGHLILAVNQTSAR